MQTCFFITMVCNVKLFVHIGCLCSTAATHSCVSCYLFAWRLPLIIIKKIWWHDFPLPSWKSEKSWKGKGRGRKRGIFFFYICDTFRRYRHLQLQWNSGMMWIWPSTGHFRSSPYQELRMCRAKNRWGSESPDEALLQPCMTRVRSATHASGTAVLTC